MQSIMILGKPYSISTVATIDDDGNSGEIDVRACTIKLIDGLADHMRQESLLHEVIHGVDEELSIGLTEEQVRRLSVGLYAVYRENEMHIIERPGK